MATPRCQGDPPVNQAIILTAGNATRAGDLAPHGCKSLVELAGIPVVEWQAAALRRAGYGDPLLVCRPEHKEHLVRFGPTFGWGHGGGPAMALSMALGVIDGPVLVAYADTFFTDVPRETDWVGVAPAPVGGRRWYALDYTDGRPFLEYRPCDEGDLVGVGLFQFSNLTRLHLATIDAVDRNLGGETGMDSVVNAYGDWHPVMIGSWQDVGDGPAIESWAPSEWHD